MKKGLKNVVYGLLGQGVILLLGILIPRLVLKNYSDETNGLLNAINQIFVYLALIEAGIGQATVQALYRPIVEKENSKISAIMSATQRYYRKLIWIYGGAVLLFASVYPLLIKIEDSSAIAFFGSTYWAVFLLILFQGFSGVVSFYFVAAYKQLFIADGQNYIISNLTTITQILVAVAKILLISFSANIVTLQVSYLIINSMVAFLYACLFKKKYAQIDFKAEPDNAALEQKNSFVVHEVSSAIFSSTDVILLSIFCDLKIASIYAIYNLVFSAVNQLIYQVHNGCFYILGQSYNKDKNKYPYVHDLYDTLYIAMVFAVISVTYLLINPFVALYTSGVSNIDYVDSFLPILFALIQLLSCCRITASNLVKISGHAKNTVGRSILESALHIIASVILVQFLGIYGVLLGTILALLYRTNDFIIYSNRRILKRSPIRQYFVLVVFFVVFGGVVIVSNHMRLDFNNYLQFFGAGLAFAFAFAVIYFGCAFIISADLRKLLRDLFVRLSRR